MTEGTLAPFRRRRITATCSVLLVVYVLGYGNQALEKWRATWLAKATSSYREPLKALDSVAWRVTPHHGEAASKVWLGDLVHNVALVLVTAMVIHLSLRGVASRRGRWSTFVGVWGATIIGSAIAGAATSPLAVLGQGMKLSLHPLAEQLFYGMLSQGLLLGLLVGLVVAVVGVLTYRSAPDPRDGDDADARYGDYGYTEDHEAPRYPPPPRADPGAFTQRVDPRVTYQDDDTHIRSLRNTRIDSDDL